MRQQPGAADIREKAEADFGHGQFRLVGDDAVRGMRRQADAATHYDAVHEGDIGFWEFLDPRVQDIFVAPQDLAEVALDLGALPERANVAAGAEPAFSRAFQQDHRDCGIFLEGIERPVDVVEHLQRHGIDGLRTVQADDSGRAFLARDQVAVCD
jgi:hypothetical protein